MRTHAWARVLADLYVGRCTGKSIEVSAGGDSPWRRPRRPTRTGSTVPELQNSHTSLSLDALAFELHPQAADSPNGSWPTEPVLDALAWLRSLATRAQPVGSTVSVRIAVAGTAQTTHNMLNAIQLLRSELLRDEHAVSRELSVSVYLIPTSPAPDDNALADCIARTDCW